MSSPFRASSSLHPGEGNKRSRLFESEALTAPPPGIQQPWIILSTVVLTMRPQPELPSFIEKSFSERTPFALFSLNQDFNELTADGKSVSRCLNQLYGLE